LKIGENDSSLAPATLLFHPFLIISYSGAYPEYLTLINNLDLSRTIADLSNEFSNLCAIREKLIT